MKKLDHFENVIINRIGVRDVMKELRRQGITVPSCVFDPEMAILKNDDPDVHRKAEYPPEPTKEEYLAAYESLRVKAEAKGWPFLCPVVLTTDGDPEDVRLLSEAFLSDPETARRDLEDEEYELEEAMTDLRPLLGYTDPEPDGETEPYLYPSEEAKTVLVEGSVAYPVLFGELRRQGIRVIRAADGMDAVGEEIGLLNAALADFALKKQAVRLGVPHTHPVLLEVGAKPESVAALSAYLGKQQASWAKEWERAKAEKKVWKDTGFPF